MGHQQPIAMICRKGDTMRSTPTFLACAILIPLAAAWSPDARGDGSYPRRGKARLSPRSVPGLVLTESSRSFESTWQHLLQALEANPAIGIVAQIDHAAAALSVGLHLPPTRLVVFGNPALGTPLMQADRRSGVDLPQKMLVFERHGRVFVAYNSASYLAARHDVDDVPTLATIANALRGLAEQATGAPVDDTAARVGFVPFFDGVLTYRSHFDVDETVARLEAAIRASPAQIVVTVDHGQNAARAGLELPPTVLTIFGNPRAGTPLMKTAPTAAIDLPLKILVWEGEDGEALVTTNGVLFLALRHRLLREGETLGAIHAALEALIDAATGR